MTHKTTQREKVEHLLRANGKRGVHTHELRAIFIANPSERIRKLREAGWVIERHHEKLYGDAYGTRYVLVSEPERGISTPEPSPGEVPPSAGASLRVGEVEGGRGEGSPSDAAPESLAGSGHSTVALSPDRLFDPPSEPTGHWRNRAA